ncbi:MAG: hypothetical protein E7035_02350 [Verrucomicrobiaceae bacterium]|nr:hypothetical protein [Verrucomicrobiaceae bacterium]
MKNYARFQKIIIFGLSLFLLSVIALLGYFSFAYDETSDKLVQAKQELELGNKNKAYDIYFSIIANDTSCEEAYRALANLAQERQNYKDAAYFWMMVSNLNPPDTQAKLNYFRAMIISGTNETLELRFETLADKSFLGDEELFAIAKSYIRSNKRNQLSVVEKLIKNPFYKELVRGVSILSPNRYSATEAIFKKALSSAKTDTEKDNALICISMVRLFDNDSTTAQKLVSQIKAQNKIILADKLLIEASIAIELEDRHTASKKYFELAKLRRYQIAPLVRSAELACSINDKQTIAEVKKLFEANDKISLELLYYMEALEFFIDNDYKKARERLSMAGVFGQIVYGKILELKCAYELRNWETISIIAQNLVKNPEQIPSWEILNVIKIFSEALNQNRDDVILLNSLLKLSPENPFANLLLMHKSFAKKDYYQTLKSARLLLQKLGYSEATFAITCASTMQIGNFADVLKLTSNRLKVAPNDVLAHIFSARANVKLNNIKEAEKFYISAVKLKPENISNACEAGNFLVSNKLFDSFFAIISDIERIKNKDNQLLALLLKSEYAKVNNDAKEQIKLLKKATNISPETGFYFEIASAYHKLGEKQTSVALLKNLAKNKNSVDINLVLASYLSKGDKSQVNEALKILQNTVSENPSNAMAFVALSKVCQQIGETAEAMNYARKATNLAPENFVADLNMGEIYLENELFENASVFLERGYQKHPSESIKNNLVKALIGISKQANTTKERKLFVLRKVLKFVPENKEIEDQIKALQTPSKPQNAN